MQQDFSRKISIVVDRNLPSWQVLNTVAHVSAYFGNKMTEPFDTGEFFTSQDGINLPRNTQYPIIVLSANSSEQLRDFAAKVRGEDSVQSMFFIKEMIETSDDKEITQLVGGQDEKEIIYLGVGVFGENGILKRLTSEFKLWS